MKRARVPLHQDLLIPDSCIFSKTCPADFHEYFRCLISALGGL